eukprot:scaffold1124_cov361-Prasinococcus_capsulatus_cf.AAC.3
MAMEMEVDMRSDTVTLPTAAMRQAMFDCEVGGRRQRRPRRPAQPRAAAAAGALRGALWQGGRPLRAERHHGARPRQPSARERERERWPRAWPWGVAAAAAAVESNACSLASSPELSDCVTSTRAPARRRATSSA